MRWSIAVAVVTAAAAALPEAAAGQSAPQRQVTFAKDIAPILQRSCQQCPPAPVR